MEIGIRRQGLSFVYRNWFEGLVLVQSRSKPIVKKLVRGVFNLFFGYRLVQVVGPGQPEKHQHEFDVRHRYQNYPQL